MRVKTETKRNEILAAAELEFSQRGFSGTTLTHVAQRMSSSKATIYNYFSSKGELFWSMLASAARPASVGLLDPFEKDLPLYEKLTQFSCAFVEMHSSELGVSLQRLLISEHDKSPASTQALRDDPEIYVWPRLAKVFREQVRLGTLSGGDPDEMVSQFRALLLGDLPLQMLFGLRGPLTEEERTKSAHSAVRIFLLAYGPR